MWTHGSGGPHRGPRWTDRSVLAAAGFNGYVLKPTTMADLHVGISKVLERVPVAGHARAASARGGCKPRPGDHCSAGRGPRRLGLVAAAVTIFLEELPEAGGHPPGLRRGRAADDVKSVAHSLKGSAAMLGALRLQQPLRRDGDFHVRVGALRADRGGRAGRDPDA